MNEKFKALPGPRLRELRRSSGLSLNELARKAGTSPSALHRYESGWGAFELKTLTRLAAALGAKLEVHITPVLRVATVDGGELVDCLRALFWDVDLTEKHLEENPDWVLRRVLQFGDWEQIHQSRLFFGDDAIRRAASHRSMDVRTRHFWDLVLGSGG